MAFTEVYRGPDGPGNTDNKFDASSFLGFLRRSHPCWQPANAAVDVRQWVFRGHWDERWPLIPSAARSIEPEYPTQLPNPLTPIISKMRTRLGIDPDVADLRKSAAAQVAAYVYAMRQFMILGNETGFIDEPAMPDIFAQAVPYPTQMPAYRNILAEYLNILEAVAYPQVGKNLTPSDEKCFPGNSAEVTALAQHHGIPTFLLDWTENPWFAAYFATTSPESLRDTQDVCVWALNFKLIEGVSGRFASQANLGAIGVNRPKKSKNAYLAAQAGVLTYISDDAGTWCDTGRHVAMERLIGNWNASSLEKMGHIDKSTPEPGTEKKSNLAANVAPYLDYVILRKVILEKRHLPRLRQLLRLEDITRVHMMPTHDNLATASLSLAIDSVCGT